MWDALDIHYIDAMHSTLSKKRPLDTCPVIDDRSTYPSPQKQKWWSWSLCAGSIQLGFMSPDQSLMARSLFQQNNSFESKCQRHSSASFVKIWMGPSRGDILMFNQSWWINCGIFWLIDWEILHMTFILLMIHKSCKSSVLVRNSSWKNKKKKTTIPTLKWFGRRISEPSSWESKGTPPMPPPLQEALVRGWFRDNVYKPWKSRPHCGSGGVAVGYLKIPMTRPIEAAIPPPSISASRHSPASLTTVPNASRCYWGFRWFTKPYKNIHIPIGSMGLVYLPTWMLNFYGKLVGKYTIAYMDGMGYKSRFYINLNDILIIPSSFPDRIVFYNWFVLSKPYHAFSSTIPSEEFLRSSLSHDKGKS